jgi:hypothetical protein
MYGIHVGLGKEGVCSSEGKLEVNNELQIRRED